MTSEPILSLRNIVKRFGGLTAVNHVNLDIYPGEVVGLLGDNGAGKSTLIKCVSGVYHPDEGEISFKGQRVNFSRPIDARKVGIETIYQDLALADNLNVSANIFLGREIRKSYFGGLFKTLNEKQMLDEARKVLETLDIKLPNFQAQIEKLSGGQRQAVAIARAVYWNAQMMIMDEPTAALGVPEQRKVLGLVKSLRSEGIPVIIISHTMQDVMDVADRMIVMRRGRVVANVPRADATVDLLVKHIVGGMEATV